MLGCNKYIAMYFLVLFVTIYYLKGSRYKFKKIYTAIISIAFYY